jgi:hypothetical protein
MFGEFQVTFWLRDKEAREKVALRFSTRRSDSGITKTFAFHDEAVQ